MGKSFAHLHNHSSYSILDGAAKIEDLVQTAKDQGSPGIGITDHGVLYGLIDFYRAAKARDISPVLGIEPYFADDRHDRSAVRGSADIDGSDKRYYHLTVLAKDNDGYQNLLKLSSDAYLEGFYYKPRADWETISQYSKGLMATSGCLGGPVLQELLHDNYDAALEKAARLQDVFGRENFYIELQNHGLIEQARTNPQLIKISRAIGAPLVATNDCHYVEHEDHVAHDSLLCVQTGAKLADEKRFRFQSDQHYLKSPEEMRFLFREVEEACDNTLEIVERSNVVIDFDTLHLPAFTIPERYSTPSEYLKALAHRGLEKRYGTPTQEQLERLGYELATLDTLGLSSYFLIVWDMVKFADREGIARGPGRGSVCGSLVAYCLNISKVDPLRYHLIFERFLNPHRIAMPDIDLDFDSRYRDRMINYAFEKYGSDRVAQIITFGKIRARKAVRDAARVLGLPPQVGDRVAKAMPELVMGEPTPLDACFNYSERYDSGYKGAAGLRDMYSTDPDVRRVVDIARGLEGLIREDGIHAAGVVIADDVITNYVPVQRKKDGPIVTQWEKNTIEDLGLLKMDFLGLRNLDIIAECIKFLGNDLNIDNIPLDDFDTFKLLQEGNTVGVFQLESAPMRALLRRLAPTSIDDIAAVVALYRPGPMGSNMHNDYADRKNHRQGVTYFHDDALEILEPTYGLMIFQEQTMRVAQKFAGYSMAEADLLRKIIGKKLIDKMKAERAKFVHGVGVQGYTEALGERIFDMIEAFAAYGFNASHAYGYGYISYQTAYLKAHFPKEYMTALAGSTVDDLDKCAVFLNEARNMGIRVMTPDINASGVNFTPVPDGIRVGLSALKFVGGPTAERITTERNEHGPYVDLMDFVQRVKPDLRELNSLALGGALDAFGTRLGIHSVAENILTASRKAVKKLVPGQEALFATNDFWDFDIPSSEFSESARLVHERDVLGLFISGHPLNDLQDFKTDTVVGDLRDLMDSTEEVLVHVMTVTRKFTKAGDEMATLEIGDPSGNIEAVCFPRTWSKLRSAIVPGASGVAELKLTKDRRSEDLMVIINDFYPVGESDELTTGDMYRLYLPEGFATNEAAVSKLKGRLLSYHGKVPVELYVSRSTKLKLQHEFGVTPSPELLSSVKELFLEFSKNRT